MSFIVVARERDDGDFESLAAFTDREQKSVKWAEGVLKYFENEDSSGTYKTFELENVDDIISCELTGLQEYKEYKV